MRILTTRGDEKSFDQEDWSAGFDLENGRAVWKKPVIIEAEMTLENDRLVIPCAFVSSDKVDAGARGIMAEVFTDGVLYDRFRKLDAVVKIKNGKRNIDIKGAR